MRAWLFALLLMQIAPAAEPPVAHPAAMRYERAIRVPAGSGQACVVLDGAIYAHAAPSLADLRIFPRAANGSSHEVPYVVTMSEPATEETQPARLLNLGEKDGRIQFDLEMPARAFTDVVLDLDPAMKNFLASATVTGSNSPNAQGQGTALGAFTLFDLTAQHLSRDTTLPLAESTLRYLHVALSMTNAPGTPPQSAARFIPSIVEGAEVTPSREAQVLYTTVATTSSITTAGRESRAVFDLPALVPVERVEFVLAPGFKGNFSRDVRVTALAKNRDDLLGDDRPPLQETIDGTILRVHSTEAGREIHSDQLGVPAILGANLQSAAKVQVAVENGDDQPLPIAAVKLEMRQRNLCFDAPGAATGGLSLYYGNPALPGPVYDYERLFVASDKTLVATLGPEIPNPQYRATVKPLRPFTERHPETLWLALIAVICALGTVALKAAKNLGREDI